MRTVDQKAFHKRRDEKNIPLKGSYDFTRNWFRSRNQATWSTFLPQRFPYDKPWKMIQIGVFEGADLCWCLENILCHPESQVTAIDPWLPTTKLDAAYMENCYQRALSNLHPFRQERFSKIAIMRRLSQDVLPQLQADSYDLIVIDGDHTSDAVLSDAINSLRVVKVGGWLLFDDVRNRIPKKDHVQQGLDRFLADYGKQVQLLWRHRYTDAYLRIS